MINFPPFSATSKIIPEKEWSKTASNSYYGTTVYKLNSASGIEKDRTEDVRVELSRSKMCMRSRKKKWQFNRGRTKGIILTDQCLFSWSVTVDKPSIAVDKPRNRKQVHQRPICHQRRKLFSFIGYKGVTWNFQIALSIAHYLNMIYAIWLRDLWSNLVNEFPFMCNIFHMLSGGVRLCANQKDYIKLTTYDN